MVKHLLPLKDFRRVALIRAHFLAAESPIRLDPISTANHQVEVMHEMERSFAKRDVAVASPQVR